jgi:hypothetical protein
MRVLRNVENDCYCRRKGCSHHRRCDGPAIHVGDSNELFTSQKDTSGTTARAAG